MAFGRTATNDEVGYWAKQGASSSISELIKGHRRYLAQDVNTHRATIRRSYIDAMGREPNDGEYKHWLGGDDTYTQLMKNHIDWLRRNPAEAEAVMDGAASGTEEATPNGVYGFSELHLQPGASAAASASAAPSDGRCMISALRTRVCASRGRRASPRVRPRSRTGFRR